MEGRETPQMHKYGASKTTQIMMATVHHVTSSSGLRKFQTNGFLFVGVYMAPWWWCVWCAEICWRTDNMWRIYLLHI